jgi:hypothetical protein
MYVYLHGLSLRKKYKLLQHREGGGGAADTFSVQHKINLVILI